ncbi:MAG: FAD-binding oxidoreductase, partial [Planctomycetes bacterium]|nr:FAD-binding oxidoreductase [Planctomycetota bacterium]
LSLSFSDSLNPLDGFQHKHPSDVLEACEIIKQAAANLEAIVPSGSGSKMNIGYAPSRKGIVLGTKKLNKVIDYPARDMTVTVQAGILVKDLNELLGKENQRLPIDDPYPADSSLGGLLATNTSGPRRFGWGTLRDYVIGISILNDEGKETKAGGRVVKNVAGYDFCKLHTGALGTLGVISQVTLKVRPRPEASALLFLRLNYDKVESVLDRVHNSKTRPVAVELLNKNALQHTLFKSLDVTSDYGIFVGFEHSVEAVKWQTETLANELGDVPSSKLEIINSPSDSALWQALGGFQVARNSGCPLTFKANIPSSKVSSWCALAIETIPGVSLQAHAGSGIVFGHIPEGISQQLAFNSIDILLQKAVRYQGNLVLPYCIPEWKASFPVWGQIRPDVKVMRKVKESLDPKAIFNPGRFVDRI